MTYKYWVIGAIFTSAIFGATALFPLREIPALVLSAKSQKFLEKTAYEKHTAFLQSYQYEPQVYSEMMVHHVVFSGETSDLKQAIAAMNAGEAFDSLCFRWPDLETHIRRFLVLEDEAIENLMQDMPRIAEDGAGISPNPDWLAGFKQIMGSDEHPWFPETQGSWLFQAQGKRKVLAWYIVAEPESWVLPEEIDQRIAYAQALTDWDWDLFQLGWDSDSSRLYFWENEGAPNLVKILAQRAAYNLEPWTVSFLPAGTSMAIMRANQPSFTCNGTEGMKRLYNLGILAAEARQWDLSLQALLWSGGFNSQAITSLKTLPLDLEAVLLGLALEKPSFSLNQRLVGHVLNQYPQPEDLLKEIYKVMDTAGLSPGKKIALLNVVRPFIEETPFEELVFSEAIDWAPIFQEVLKMHIVDIRDL